MFCYVWYKWLIIDSSGIGICLATNRIYVEDKILLRCLLV